MESSDYSMDEKEKHPETVRYVRADRISTEDKAKKVEEEEVCVIEEAPLTIEVGGLDSYTLLSAPLDKRALAVGFLYGEGIIEQMEDIVSLNECEDDSNTIRIHLKDDVTRSAGSGRNLMIVSSCGACGSENLRERIDALPKVGDNFTMETGLLHLVYNDLRDKQTLFKKCGGTHAAAVFDSKGKIVYFAEDTGRHNALDKAIGKCLLTGKSTAGLGVALTSRLSLEMVSRCARAGIELIAAVSAPTSLAIEVADKCNITLCAFVRENRATVFTHPARVSGKDD
jgi:FdhD protein